jgi:hypothetical protein
MHQLKYLDETRPMDEQNLKDNKLSLKERRKNPKKLQT